jgi:hypothetical protein
MPSSGEITVSRSAVLSLFTTLTTSLIDRQESSHQLGFTYVQGMNVLAAPFLYTMPSELEAFFCFAKFIEESCPLYVQPTLEGVHRGLRVRDATLNCSLFFYSLNSFLIDASKLWTRSCSTTCAQRIFLPNYMRFLVSALAVVLAGPLPSAPSCSHALCVHTTARSSPPAVGLPPGLWCPP